MLNNGALDLHLGSYGLKRVGHFDECGGLCYDRSQPTPGLTILLNGYHKECI